MQYSLAVASCGCSYLYRYRYIIIILHLECPLTCGGMVGWCHLHVAMETTAVGECAWHLHRHFPMRMDGIYRLFTLRNPRSPLRARFSYSEQTIVYVDGHSQAGSFHDVVIYSATIVCGKCENDMDNCRPCIQ